MLTVALQGGLGNQLFQWALGKAFEHRGHQVQYDTALFDGDPGRRYMLDQLGLNLKLSHRGGTGHIIQEGSMRYKPGLLQSLRVGQDATLIGYWQCEKYFADVPGLRELLLPIDFYNRTRVPGLSDESIQVAADIICRSRSCFVHVRRSDNLRPAGITVHGLLCHEGYQYYERSMNWVRERVPGVHFFVFSDDAEWCLKNFVGPDITVVHHNAPSFTVDAGHDIHFKAGGREVEDLWLMSLCRHAIIANSTFSWWGAWLGDGQYAWKISDDPKRPDVAYRDYQRLVIAPEPWFNSKDLDYADIIPERWLKIGIK